MMRMKRSVTTLAIVIILSNLLIIPMNTSATAPPPPSPSIDLQWTSDRGNYTGAVTFSTYTFTLEMVRVSLFDVNKRLRETGLLSEYSENKAHGDYIRFYDVNDNDKLDPADLFVITQKGVSENWGITLTHEKTGKELVGVTLSNRIFTMEKEDKEEDNRDIHILIFELNLFGLLVTLVYIQTRKK